jgi:hypothetical protein
MLRRLYAHRCFPMLLVLPIFSSDDSHKHICPLDFVPSRSAFQIFPKSRRRTHCLPCFYPHSNGPRWARCKLGSDLKPRSITIVTDLGCKFVYADIELRYKVRQYLYRPLAGPASTILEQPADLISPMLTPEPPDFLGEL